MPAFRSLNDHVQAGTPHRVRVLALGLEPEAVVSDYLRANHLTAFKPIAIPRGSQFAPIVRMTPAMVLADRKGIVLATWPGLITKDRLSEVVRRIDATLPQ